MIKKVCDSDGTLKAAFGHPRSELPGWPGRQWTHHEVELLSLLLVRSSLGDAGLTQVGLRDSRLHRLCGATVLEAFRNIIVFDGDHVLYCLQGGFSRFLDLGTGAYFSH